MYAWLVPRVVFPLYERVSRCRPWSRVAKLRELQWRSAAELEVRTLEKLRLVLSHANAHVPYYGELLQQAGVKPADVQELADLSRVPITRKSALRARFPEGVVADNAPTRRHWKISTSGSTGFPFEFYADRADREGWVAARLFFEEWAGAMLWDTAARIVDPEELDANVPGLPKFSRGARRILLGERVTRFSGQDLTAEEFRTWVGRLGRKRPYFIRGYPTYIARLAAELVDANVELPVYPQAVMAGGETLSASDAGIIGRAFGCRVFNHYSSWEVPHMAQSCPDNPEALHVNSDRVLLRVVGEDGNDVKPGEEGGIVATHLSNYVMPFINYDLGDRAVAGGECGCGRGLPTLRSLEGRLIETIQTPTGKVVTTSALTGLLMRRHPVIEYIWQYQAEQTAANVVLLRVVPTPRYSSEYAESLRTHIEAFLGPGMSVSIETVEHIPTEKSGKHLTIKPHRALP